MDQIDVALEVGRALEQAGATWMVGGSIATSSYGEPRATHDVDLVADLLPSRVEPFVRALGEAFYADQTAIEEATRRHASFNVIHTTSIDKVDVFCLRGDRFDRAGLDGRIQLDLGRGRTAPVASADHMVVEKLRWFRRAGEVSDRQWRDVQGVLQIQGTALHIESMRKWAIEIGVDDLLERALRDAGL